MFLSFGRKASTAKKSEAPAESPRTPSSANTSPVKDVGSRSAVQTVAGPLLSSTRFNTGLDASTFANVNSPGFTSRVVNCASNGSSPYRDDGAVHQSKYNSVGLFPRVHLGGQSILPILSPRISQKVGRTPVRVRIAPPSLSERSFRRHSISGGRIDAPKDRSDSLKRSPSLTRPSVSKESSTTTPRSSENVSSTLENFQEASRKRIFSESQDAWDESKKRRRKAEIPIPNPNDDMYHYRHVRAPAIPSSSSQAAASSQGKRAREKGSPEEQKNQRRKTCNSNNAIFSSLSSSRNLLERLTAQKRKSMDTSRSGSPVTPLSGKQVKEIKTASTDVKAIQCNLDEIARHVQFAVNAKQAETPVSSIVRRKDVKSRENDECMKKGLSLNGLQGNPTCDYTTKLFRKEVLSHSPRTPVTKSQKQSLWVRAPEADELTCSLLSDDANLERPERLKSLLACVSGKDKKSEDKNLVASTASATRAVTGTAQISVATIGVPSSTGSKMLSPSSAVTVTVSSTCTIMTSATVTSVNGVPSSESGRSPPPLPISSSSSTAPSVTAISSSTTPAVPLSLTGTATTSTPGTNFGTTSFSALSNNTTAISGLAPSSLSPKSSFGSPVINQLGSSGLATNTSSVTTNPAVQFGSSGPAPNGSSVVLGQSNPASSAPNISGTASFSNVTMQLPVNTNSTGISQVVGTTTVTSPVAQFGSNIGATASVTTQSPASKPLFQLASQADKTSDSSAKPSFQFGASGGNQSADATAAAKPSFSLGAGAVSDASKPTFQFSSNTSGSSDVPKPAFQFGSAAKPALQLGANGLATNTSSVTTNPAVQFGSSGPAPNSSSAVPKSTFGFDSGGGGSAGAPKSSFQFGSSNPGSSAAPQPSFQMGAAVPANIFSQASKSPYQFKPSGSEPSAVQTIAGGPGATLGNSSMGSSQPTFQFGSSGGGSQVKPTLQFGASSPSSTHSETPKAAFQFASSGNGSSKPAFQFATNGSGPSEASKSVFQFATSGTGSNGLSENPKSAFQFTSNASGSESSGFQFGSSTKEVTRSASFSSTGVTTGAFQFASNNSGLSGNANSAFQFSRSNSTNSISQSVNGAADAVKSPFQLGSSLGATSDPPKPSFQFSSNPSGKTTFGSQTTGSVFGQSVSQQTKGAPTFGSSGSFGSTNSGSATSISFGSSSSSSSFGAPASNAQSSLPSFGSIAQPNGFGSSSSFGSSGSASFSFNSNGTSAKPSAFPATTNAGGVGGPFAFGQKQDQAAPQAFSFNASVAAVPNSSGQAGQAPGLFSVGAGSSSQRRTQTARRRR